MQAHDVTLFVVTQMAKKIVYTSQTEHQVLRQGFLSILFSFYLHCLELCRALLDSFILLNALEPILFVSDCCFERSKEKNKSRLSHSKFSKAKRRQLQLHTKIVFRE